MRKAKSPDSLLPPRIFFLAGLSCCVFGCIFDSKNSQLLLHSTSSTVVLDTLYPASAEPARRVELYQPILDGTLAAGAVGAREEQAPVNVKEHASGQVVQYRLTRQRFGSWSPELEFKWNFFKLQSNFFFYDSLPDTTGLDWRTGDFFKRVHAADSFTNYFDSAHAEAIWNQIESSSKPGAIGIEVHLNEAGDTVFIKRVVAGSPGDRAGLKPGMAILAVDDSAIVGDSAIDRFSRFAKGDSGTSTTFTMLAASGVFHATMVRAPVAFPTVQADTIDGVPYISVSSFTLETVGDKNTHLEFRDALRATRGFPVTLLDLRDNHGGVLDLAIKMCDEVLPQGQVIIHEEQRLFSDARRAPLVSVNTYHTSSGGLGEGRKFVILTNHWTASAAEIFLVALRDNLKSPQVGARSYGKGVGQFPVNTPGKGLALVTFLHFTTSKGLDYHKKGLDPDYPDAASPDSVLTHAAAIAKGMAGGNPKVSAAARMRVSRGAKAMEWNRGEALRLPGVL